MLNSKNFKFAIIVTLILIVVIAFFINNYQLEISKRQYKLIKLPDQISGECGIQNCHGLNITCGSNIPDACDMMYVSGDICRQFVDCKYINGQCILNESSRFNNCKTCVEKCEQDYSNDQFKFFECESSCAE